MTVAANNNSNNDELTVGPTGTNKAAIKELEEAIAELIKELEEANTEIKRLQDVKREFKRERNAQISEADAKIKRLKDSIRETNAETKRVKAEIIERLKKKALAHSAPLT